MKEAIEALGYSHMMRDYKPEDYCFDAILNYKNYLTWEDTVKLKYYEIFDKDKFHKFINEHGQLDIYVVDNDFTYKLLEKYNNGDLHEDEDVLEFVLEYAG